MFRDSFGNTLLPLMADVFANGYFSKGVPQNIAGYMDMYNPEVVIFEKVERNISELVQSPPVVESSTVKIDKKLQTENSNTSINVDESKNNADYLEISGAVDASFCEKGTDIYVRISDVNADINMDMSINTENVYKTLYTTAAGSDYGYKLYVSKENFSSEEATFDIIIENKGTFQIVKSKTVKIEGAIQNNTNSKKNIRQKNQPRNVRWYLEKKSMTVMVQDMDIVLLHGQMERLNTRIFNLFNTSEEKMSTYEIQKVNIIVIGLLIFVLIGVSTVFICVSRLAEAKHKKLETGVLCHRITVLMVLMFQDRAF